MQFFYRAHTEDGAQKSGVLDAPNRLSALKALAGYGWQVDYCGPRPEPVRVSEPQAAAGKLTRIFWPLLVLRPWPGHMSSFYNQLASLLGAGVSPHEAAASLSERAASGALRTAMAEVSPNLAAGASLSEELARYPQLFPPQDLGLLRAADASGDWEGICRELEESYGRLYKGLHWFLVARVYYSFLLAAVVLVPPVPWIMVYGASWYFHLLLTRLMPVLLLLLMMWMVLRVLSGLQITRPIRDRVMLLMPLLRGYELRAAGLRFLRALASLLRAGIGVGEAMDLAADATGNLYLARRVHRAAEGLRRGVAIENVTQAFPFLTAAERGTLATAFHSGRLEEGFRRLTEDARESTARRLWGVRIGSVILLSTVMTVLATIAFIIGWLNLYAAAAEKAGVGDIWQELWGK